MTIDSKIIEDKLRGITGLPKLREFLAFLGYQYVDRALPTRDLRPELKERIKTESLRQIAQYADFPIIFCEINVPPEAKIRSRLKTERLLLRALPEKYADCLLITHDPQSGLWHFVNSKPVGKKLRLRRFAVGPEEKLRTAAERLTLIRVEPGDDWARLLKKHEDAFDREKVSDEFFKKYRELFLHWKVELNRKIRNDHTAHNFLQQFLNRLMFIYFIQRKGWLGSDGNTEFIKKMWETYRGGKYPKNSFYDDWLHVLFFDVLNKSRYLKRKNLPDEINAVFAEAPFLNGGLFKVYEGIDDQGIHVPDALFEDFFSQLLDAYNFTVEEDTPFDQSVSVDPEMLGVVYEQLVNVTDSQDEQASSGIFYTPRIEVDFMCRRSLLEYLAKNAGVDRAGLYRFLFDDDTHAADLFGKSDLDCLKEAIRNVQVVDPACGSGAFLVGMMQVILDAERRLFMATGRGFNEFEAKKRIIERSLYGVDVKDWAINIAQLRLWLSLIVDADEKQLDLQGLKIAGEALLPSLAFKIREGDSLVQEIAGKPFPIRDHARELDEISRRKISELRKHKSDYFFNRSEKTEKELRRIERGVYATIIDRDIKRLEDECKKLKLPFKLAVQEVMFKASRGEQTEMSVVEEEERRQKSKLAAIEMRIEELQSLKAELGRTEYLFWGIEFAEIFFGNGKQGFDIVIGNPPYVRQERIADPRQDDPSKEQRKEYKTKLQQMAKLDWGETMKVGGQADLYVYFYLRGLRLLNPDGVFCFITSNSWLDVAYGKELQEFLVTRAPIYAIYDNQAKRSFKHADVNTIIALFGAPGKNESALEHTARFVMFKKPFAETITVENLLKVEGSEKITTWDDARVFPIVQQKLWEDGLDLSGGESSDDAESQNAKTKKANQKSLVKNWTAPYIGNKWGGKYLRAPDIYWTILEKGRGKLVRLGDIAEVRFGIKTGANEFFYLDQDKIDEWGIEEEFLRTVIKSPRECKGFVIKPNELKYKLFMCHKDKRELNGTAALEYIKWGEKQKFQHRPSCKGRMRWWDLGIRLRPHLIFNYLVDKMAKTLYAGDGCYCSDNFQEVHINKNNSMALFYSLNSEIFQLMVNIEGRSNFGGGLLKVQTYEVERLYCVSPNIINVKDQLILGSIKCDISEISRQCTKLDECVFQALGLNPTQCKTVYDEVQKMIQNRHIKAGSLDN
jgi:type I restriction-modification system DNA methylase subunit